MFTQMHRRGKAFWQWSAEEWCDVVGVTAESFEAANRLPRWREGLRPHLLDVAYLLCGFERFGPIWTATAFYPMARVVFGAGVLDGQIARLDAALANNGYSSGRESIRHRHQASPSYCCSIAARGSMTSHGVRCTTPHRWPVLMPRASFSAGSPKPWSFWESSRPASTMRRGIPSLWDLATACRRSGTRGIALGVRSGLAGWHRASPALRWLHPVR